MSGMERPKRLVPPAYLSPSPPIPGPDESAPAAAPSGESDRPDPTRYGDWEKKGIAVDF